MNIDHQRHILEVKSSGSQVSAHQDTFRGCLELDDSSYPIVRVHLSAEDNWIVTGLMKTLRNRLELRYTVHKNDYLFVCFEAASDCTYPGASNCRTISTRGILDVSFDRMNW